MKKYIVYLSSFLFVMFQLACNRSAMKQGVTSYDFYLEQMLGGKHQLRKMTEGKERTKTTSNASFFLFTGHASSTTETKTIVTFAWKLNGSGYAISSIPIEKIHVIPTKSKSDSIPVVKFKWKSHFNESGVGLQTQYVIDNDVEYMELYVRDEDWSPSVELPLN